MEMKLQGPFEIELKIHMRAGEHTAKVTYQMPAGEFPTRQTVEAAIADALAKVTDQIGSEVRLATRPEFFNEILAERTGHPDMEFASPEEWDS